MLAGKGACIVWLVTALGLAGGTMASAGDGADEGTRNARALVKSIERIEWRSDLGVPVASLPKREGERFSKGDTLVAFDCSRLDAERKASAAASRAAGLDYSNKRKLLAHAAIGKNEVALAGAKLAEAKAELEVHEVRSRDCSFEAPFDGRVVTLNAEVLEVPPADQPLLTVIRDGELELEIVVPSTWLRWINTGQGFSVRVDETGEEALGTVKRIHAEVDPVSQTVMLVGSFKAQPERTLSGMSGEVIFQDISLAMEGSN